MLVAGRSTADSLLASAVAQPEADCKNYCHTFLKTLHHAPSGAICRDGFRVYFKLLYGSLVSHRKAKMRPDSLMIKP